MNSSPDPTQLSPSVLISLPGLIAILRLHSPFCDNSVFQSMTDFTTHASSLDDKEVSKNSDLVEDGDPDAGLSEEERAKIVGNLWDKQILVEKQS